MRTGTANLPLHSGKAPAWLFGRMVELAGCMAEMIVSEYGPDTLLQRLADPRWFQAFGCVLGFDWHSSGLTTTACGALKESVKGKQTELGLFIAGGKGAASRKTPDEIRSFCDRFTCSTPADDLVRASRLSAKVDNTALQDGYQLYHHVFFFSPSGTWSVVQQGKNDTNHYARRYHWNSAGLDSFVSDPHAGIASPGKSPNVLNSVAKEAAPNRDAVHGLVLQGPGTVNRELKAASELKLPARHHITANDFSVRGLEKTLVTAYETQPVGFEDVLLTPGMGPKALRALVLVAELAYGTPASWRDPASFAFAHGGKDGIPYPVDRPVYDGTVALLKQAIGRSRMGQSEKLQAVRTLARFWPDI